MAGRAYDIRGGIGIIGGITARLCPALLESITFPVAVSAITHTRVLRDLASAQHVKSKGEEGVGGYFARETKLSQTVTLG